MRILNKKADIATTLLVLMTLVLVGATLFSFVSGKKIDKRMVDARFIENLYLKEEQFRFYMRELGERALVESYTDTAKAASLTNFEYLADELNEKMKGKFTEELEEERREYPQHIVPSDIIEMILGKIDNNQFDVTLSDEILKIETKHIFQDLASIEKPITFKILYEPKEILHQIAISYQPKINIKFNLTEEGLHSFAEIIDKRNDCKAKLQESLQSQEGLSLEERNSLLRDCLAENLKNFNVQVILKKYKEEEKEYPFVTLTSKKLFFIDGEFKQVETGFFVM